MLDRNRLGLVLHFVSGTLGHLCSVPAVLLLPEVVGLLLSLAPGLMPVKVTVPSAVEVLVDLGGGKSG